MSQLGGVLAVIAAVVVIGQVFHDIALQAAVAELADRDPETLHQVNGRMFSLDTAGKSLIGPPAGAAALTAAGWSPTRSTRPASPPALLC
ncbi:hypothetical protein [Micromonospora sp. NPDC049171]|uniref:hypothetical protein n=1 Tax=Micromonospora sp. NPDC049171 TaxID=3155770 RepID=UPI003401EB30